MKSLEELIQAVGRVARDGVKGGIGVVVAESNEFRRFRGLVWQQSVGFKEMQIVLLPSVRNHLLQLINNNRRYGIQFQEGNYQHNNPFYLRGNG